MLFLCSIQFGSAEAGGGPGSVSVVFPDLLFLNYRTALHLALHLVSIQVLVGAASR